LGDALKIAMQGMIKFIVLIAISAIAIPCLWEILFPFLISQGYDPDSLTASFSVIGGIK
jgi:hypothetical protein